MFCEEEYYGGEVSDSLNNLMGVCDINLSLVVLTLISWLRLYLPVFPTLEL